jgi:hypothetical protein
MGALMVGLLVLALLPGVAGGADWHFDGSTGIPPSINYTNEYIGYSGTGSVTQTGGTNQVTNDLYLGNNTGSSGVYTLSGGSSYASVGGSEYIGYSGTGDFTQSGGTHYVANNLYIGRNNGSSGAYTQSGGTTSVDKYLVVGRFAGSRGVYDLSGGSLSVGAGGTGYYEYIGYSGTGDFTQSGGTHQVANDLYLGLNTGGSGAYNLSGGSSLLKAQSEYIGYSGTGAYTQSGGTHQIANQLYIGTFVGSSGDYDLSGGSLSADYENIGSRGCTGAFTQSGGTHQVSNELKLSYASYYFTPSSGAYELTGGSLSVGTYETIGVGVYETKNISCPAAFTQSGGTHQVGNDLRLGWDLGGQGSYDLSGSGSLSVGQDEYIGNSGIGAFTQSSGDHQVHKDLYMGWYYGSSGAYTQSSGSLSVGRLEFIGYFGTGAYTQTGGIHQVTNQLILGVVDGGSGTYNLSGGGLAVDWDEYIGYTDGGIGAFTQSGGTNSVAFLTLASASGSSGTYNLTGGSLAVGQDEYIGNSGTGAFTQSRGTHAVGGTLALGAGAPSEGVSGTYTLTGGSLYADTINLQYNSLFAQTGGTLQYDTFNLLGGTVQGRLENRGTFKYIWGLFSGRLLNFGQLDLFNESSFFTAGNGLAQYSATPVTLGSGQSLTLNGQGLEVGRGASFNQTGGILSVDQGSIGSDGIGAFNQSGGTHRVNQSLFLGDHIGSSGAYTLSDNGSLWAGQIEYIGYQGTGAFTQSGGTNSVGTNLYLGRLAGGSGAYTLSGDGSLYVGANGADYNEYIGYSGNGAFTQSGGTNLANNDLYLGYNSNISGAYTLRGGSLNVVHEFVGYSGSGAFTQSGGTNRVNQELYLGRNTGGNGAYNLSDSGSLSVGYHEIVGNSGTGSFTQSGGTHQVGMELHLGEYAGSSGSYTLSAGSLSVGYSSTTFNNECIGNFGTGVFTQTGGSHQIANNLYIGRNANSRGAYDLSGGSLSANYEYVGDSGVGAFTQSGGSHRVANQLYLGRGAGSSGSYNLSDNGSLWVGYQEYIGYGGSSTSQKGGTGAFNQSGGTHRVNAELRLGENAGSRGAYTLSNSGSLSVRYHEFVGDNGTGTFTQSGGTHQVGMELHLGEYAGSSGSYTLSAGSLSAGYSSTLYNNECIGNSGTGVFTQTGGSHQIANNLYIGRNATSRGAYDLSGGSLSANYEYVGNSGVGAFTQSGGTHIVTNTLTVANASGSSGSYNLTGGSLSADTIDIKSGGAFNVTGETEKLVTSVTGSVTNAGAVRTTNADVTWKGTFTLTEGGEYHSDPSTQTFDDLVVEARGCIMADPADTYIIRNNFQNQSARNTEWHTEQAVLNFVTAADNVDNVHDLYINGRDFGSNPASTAGNFAWGTLNIDGQTVHLYDGNLDTPGGALYVGLLYGLAINETNLVINNIFGQDAYVLNIYYDPLKNPDLHQDTYTFAEGKGSLMPTPLPASLLLLGSGLLGLALLRRRRPSG